MVNMLFKTNTKHAHLVEIVVFKHNSKELNHKNGYIFSEVPEETGIFLFYGLSYLEPINGAAVDEGRELSQSVPEGVSNGTEGNDNVKVLPTAIHEESKQGQRTEVSHLVSCLGQWSHSLSHGKIG